MKPRFGNKKMMYAAFGFTLLKVFLTFAYFFYNRAVSGTFPSMLYIYLFIFTLFPKGLETAVKIFSYLFVGASVPSLLAMVVLRHNRKFAGYGAFVLMLLSLADILFVVAKGWLAEDPLFVTGGICLNLLIVLCLVLMHRSGPPKSEEE